MTHSTRSILMLAASLTLGACAMSDGGFGDTVGTNDGSVQDTLAVDAAHDVTTDHAGDTGPRNDVVTPADANDVADVSTVDDTGPSCGAGQCTVGSTVCSTGEMCCALMGSTTCGTCETSCTGTVCPPGECTPGTTDECGPGVACLASVVGHGMCSGHCATSGDAGHVSDGGSASDAGDVVDSGGGACSDEGGTCATGLTCCDGGCKNFENDPMNCGACGTACSGAMSMCNGGVCVAPTCPVTCPAGDSCCIVPGGIMSFPTCRPGPTCPVGCPTCA